MTTNSNILLYFAFCVIANNIIICMYNKYQESRHTTQEEYTTIGHQEDKTAIGNQEAKLGLDLKYKVAEKFSRNQSYYNVFKQRILPCFKSAFHKNINVAITNTYKPTFANKCCTLLESNSYETRTLAPYVHGRSPSRA